jgi:hypothetical protein
VSPMIVTLAVPLSNENWTYLSKIITKPVHAV